MKTKFLLPMLAMIVAVGMSFTTVKDNSDPDTDYIWRNGAFESLDMELNCGVGNLQCRVLKYGTEHDVYDDDTFSSVKKGNGELIIP